MRGRTALLLSLVLTLPLLMGQTHQSRRVATDLVCTDCVAPADMGASDFGDWTCSAGDSCTLDAGVVDATAAAAALKTEVACAYIETPVTDEDLPTVWRAPVAVTITEIFCETDAGTSGLELTNDDGSPTGVNGSDISCTTSGVSDTSFAGDAAFAQDHKLDINVGTVSTATRLSVCWRYTYD